MGIWSAVKYALNSTLGTSGFKPLDQLIADSSESMETYIDSYVGQASRHREQLDYTASTISHADGLAFVPILEISNSRGGYIYDISFGETATSYGVNSAEIKIEIDGELFYDKRFGSCNRREIIFNDFIHINYNGTTTYASVFLPPPNHLTTIDELNLENTTIDSENGWLYWFEPTLPFPSVTTGNKRKIIEIMPKPLRFNESITISVKGTSTSSQRSTAGRVVYALDL